MSFLLNCSSILTILLLTFFHEKGLKGPEGVIGFQGEKGGPGDLGMNGADGNKGSAVRTSFLKYNIKEHFF